MFLGEPEIAQIVVDSIHRGAALGHYELHAWVVMPNHVHLLATPLIGLSKLLCSLKRTTAMHANVLLCRTGSPFWQDECFDHVVRSDAEFRRIMQYIENNPVRAGLCVNAEDFPWSSARRAESPPQAKCLPHKS
jgi:REP element-mobilizing transposase RayT